jgi:formylglycine-generating enzyme required for sulfatase activity
VAYCNWLSRQEGVPREQWCYETNEKGDYAEGMKISADFQQRAGYRLPTDAEWEYVCRANTRTPFSFGDSDELLERYAWSLQNSRNRSWPVGRLRPNALGAFDMHGNDLEWCQDGEQPRGERHSGGSETVKRNSTRVMHGGAFNVQSFYLSSAYRYFNQPGLRGGNAGLRLARACL